MTTLKNATLTVLAVLIAWGAPLSTAYAQKVGTKEKPLIIATGRFHGFLPSYRVAAELNAKGIVTETIEFPSATERLEAVAAGYASVAYAGLTASVLLRSRGKNVVVVASTNEKGRALVAAKSVANVAALKGKKIGVTFASIEHMTLLALLRDNGLDSTKDVALVNMPLTDQPIAFNSGSIDAYMGPEPWPSFGVAKFGAKILALPYNTSLGAIDSGVQVSEELLRNQPELVDAVVRAHVNAVNYFRANPEEIIKVGVANFKVPEDVMRESLKNVELTFKINVDAIKALAKFQSDMKLISQAEFDRIDWSKFINSSFVDKAAR